MSSYKLCCLILMIIAGMVDCVRRSATTSSFTATTITTLKCQAQMLPNDILVKQSNLNIGSNDNGESDGDSQYLTIKCASNLTGIGESFTHPAFDLSFGDTSNTGLYIIRGKAKCSWNNTKCESVFQVPSLALKKLLLPVIGSVSQNDDAIQSSSYSSTSKSRRMNHQNHQHQLRSSSVIKVTCDVADTSKHSRLPVRCTDSGIIHFAKVLQYGEKCSVNESKQECDRNMRCVNDKCQCKASFLNATIGQDDDTNNVGRIVCLQPVNLGQKCLVNQQCTVLDTNSMCEYDEESSHKTCQCQPFFQIITSHSKLICERIKAIPESSPITVMDESTYNYRQMLHSSTLNTNFSTLNNNNQDSDSRSYLMEAGLVLFVFLLFWVLVSAIYIRYVKQRNKLDTELDSNQVTIDSSKSAQNNKNNNKCIMGLAYKQQHQHSPINTNINEDVEVKIYDKESDLISYPNSLSINNEAPEINNKPQRHSPQQQQYLSTSSLQSQPRSAPNFDIFAKQSVV